MLVTCIVSVIVMWGNVPVFSKAQLTGKVLRSSETNYLIDFTRDPITKRLKPESGEFSNQLVEKAKCG